MSCKKGSILPQKIDFARENAVSILYQVVEPNFLQQVILPEIVFVILTGQSFTSSTTKPILLIYRSSKTSKLEGNISHSYLPGKIWL